MQTNLLWTGREYYSLENCLVTTNESGSEINSVIVGRYQEKIYRVEYHIKTNQYWETVFIKLDSQHDNQRKHFKFESDGKGNWRESDRPLPEFKNCLDVDIPLTPFTNTLPINRLKLVENIPQEIQVIYFDLLEQQIKPVRQKYVRLSSTSYHYENVPNDFKATIQVDDQGFVVDYPQLFVRTAALTTDYN